MAHLHDKPCIATQPQSCMTATPMSLVGCPALSTLPCTPVIKHCQVGIVGRTGSGKTTLLMALFRMIGLAGGRIIMDGRDIGALPLREVRDWGWVRCDLHPVACQVRRHAV